MDKYTLKMNYSAQSSKDLLDYLVNQALLEWQVYNINPDDENYMNETNINNAITYIMKKIMLEMTDTVREQLSVGYPMETEEQMLESIKNKAKLVVLNYTIKQNEPTEAPLRNINAF